MSFDIEHKNRKDHRKRFYGSKAFDRSCRNHGSCGYCHGNRTHSSSKRKAAMILETLDWKF